MCNFSQCPAGGSRVLYKEKGKASAQLPEILPRLQAAQGLGVPHPRVTAPAGRQLPGTSCGENAPSQTHPEVQQVCASVCAVCQVLQNNSENIFFLIAANAIKSGHMELRHFPLWSSHKRWDTPTTVFLNRRLSAVTVTEILMFDLLL